MNLTSYLLLGVILLVIGFLSTRSKKTHIEIFVDVSGSMAMFDIKTMLLEFLSAIRQDTTITFRTFAGTVTTEQQFADAQAAYASIEGGSLKFETGGHTDFNCVAQSLQNVKYDYACVLTDTPEECAATLRDLPRVNIHNCNT